MIKRLTLLTLILLSCEAILFAQAPAITIQPYAAGLSSPVDINNCGDSRLFVVEQDGYIRILPDSGNVLTTPFLNIDPVVASGGERGLLGLAFHPDYKQNGYFYVYYTANNGNLTIARYSVTVADSNLADAASALVLMSIPHPAGNHNGGCIRFGKDGYLYFATGDGGGGGDQDNNAQNPAVHLGKMLRIDVDNGTPYAIPPDNPFLNDTAYEPEIWGLGLRNPWRWGFDRMNGDLWIGDVGQGAWEEIDYIPYGMSGINFGWRCYEGNHGYNTAGCQPQSSYYPATYELSSGAGYHSVIGGYVYRGGKYGDMFGCYFFGDNVADTIHVLKKNASGTFDHYTPYVYPASLSGFGEDYLGNLYVAELGGNVRKIVSTNCAPVAYVSDLDTVRVCADSVLLESPFAPGQIYAWLTPSGTSGGTQVWVSQDGWAKLTVITIPGGCIGVDSAYIDILGAPPAASFTGLDTTYCSNFSPVDTLFGSPSGGVFAGTGITNDIFDPATAGDGIYIISYIYTDSNNCVSSFTQNTTVETCTEVFQTASAELEIIKVISTGNGLIELHVKSKANAPGQYFLNDCMGRTIAAGNMRLTEGEQVFTLPVKAESGIYFWTLQSNHDAVTFRFAVTR
jgi:glucose/arabinose dehydrogenase